MESGHLAGIKAMKVDASENLSLGLRLQKARLEKKYSLNYVAEKLHLSKQQVESLERDDYSYVSALAYARGHLRLYAKLVDLPVTEILKIFDGLGLKDKTKPVASPIKFQPKKKGILPLKNKQWIGAAAVGILAILSLMALTKHHQNKAKVVQVMDSPTVTTVPTDTVQIPLALPPDAEDNH